MKRVPALYLASYALSVLGNSIAAVALPLIVLQTTGSLLSTGVLAAATAVPAFLAGLFLGAVIDRVDRRTSSVVTDLVSAVALAALPLVDLVTGLDLGWFIVFGILGALGDVPGLTAREALLPAIVRHGSMPAETLIGAREGLGALVLVVGPAAVGSLMVLFDGSTVLWITAATSFAAALVTLLIPRRVGAIAAPVDGPLLSAVPPSAGSSWGQLKEGWRFLFLSSRSLRAVTTVNLLFITVVASLQGILLPAHFAALGRSGLLGFVLTALAVGTLVGAGVYATLSTRWQRRTWFGTGLAGTVTGISIVATLPAVEVVFAGAVVLGISTGLLGSLIGVLMLEGIPDRMRGRVMGTQNSLMLLAAPAGVVVVAVIGSSADLRTAGISMAVLWAVTATVASLAPSLHELGVHRADREDGDEEQ